MSLNLPDISQLQNFLDDAPAVVAQSVEEEKQLQAGLLVRRDLHRLAKRLFKINESEFALKSRRIFERKIGKWRWIHDLIPRALSIPERRDIAKKLAVAFPGANRAARRKAAFSGSWMVLV